MKKSAEEYAVKKSDLTAFAVKDMLDTTTMEDDVLSEINKSRRYAYAFDREGKQEELASVKEAVMKADDKSLYELTKPQLRDLLFVLIIEKTAALNSSGHEENADKMINGCTMLIERITTYLMFTEGKVWEKETIDMKGHHV